jgi:hypothetical protein
MTLGKEGCAIHNTNTIPPIHSHTHTNTRTHAHTHIHTHTNIRMYANTCEFLNIEVEHHTEYPACMLGMAA